MCGIFGVLNTKFLDLGKSQIRDFYNIAILSERRGSDASGLEFDARAHFRIVKCNAGISKLLREEKADFKNIKTSMILGHTRLSTHGSMDNPENNQPAVSKDWAIFHNGIVTNAQEFSLSENNPLKELDTYAINTVLERNWPDQVKVVEQLNLLEGEITFIANNREGIVICYTNVGNLYISKINDLAYIASENIFLQRSGFKNAEQLGKNFLHVIRGNSVVSKEYLIKVIQPRKKIVRLPDSILNLQAVTDIEKMTQKLPLRALSILRCNKCLLPVNFPSIQFDSEGTCQICLTWKNPVLKDIAILAADLQHSKKIVLNLSGGRDSCYALIKMYELGYEITAFTYDWGFISTAARENMANLCGSLGIEHVIVSPDLEKNREIVSNVLLTWFKFPDLGVIPLLMAGDKPFHSFSIRVSDERGKLPIVQADHYLETTGFKSMLAGAKVNFQSTSGGVNYRLDIFSTLRMTYRYCKFIMHVKGNRVQVFKQVVSSFLIYYRMKHNFIRIFDYVSWNEANLEKDLKKFGWKTNDRSHKSRWRMGDSTAPMYNCLYLWNIGYTENDAMLSNQIRAGLITREEAVNMLPSLNAVDAEGIVEYLETIGIDPKIFVSYLQNHS